jgi:predicted phage terminase large subunit-like protein
MVVAYQYGQDFYVEHFVCDNGKVEFITSKMAQVLYDYKVNMCQVESNRGGTLFAQEIQSKLEDLGGHTTITTKWTQSNKETRIEVNSMLVKKHFLFKDQSVYQTDKEYRTAMNFLYSYTMMGKNKYDDVPDAMSLFVEYALVNRRSSVKIMKRPF